MYISHPLYYPQDTQSLFFPFDPYFSYILSFPFPFLFMTEQLQQHSRHVSIIIYIYFKMKFKQYIVLSLLSLILLTVQQTTEQRSQQIPTSKVGDVIKGVSYKIDQGRSFQLINIPSLDKKYLFVALTSDQIYAHLELNLTVYKEGAQTPLKRCIKEEVDACYIPREVLSVNQTIFVVIDSGGEECDYELRTYWSDLQHIIVGTQVKFMFSKQQKRQIYHLQLKDQQFKQLRIIVRPETRRFAFDKIKMYGTFGKDSLPSADNHDFKSVYLWQDIEGIFLTKKQIKDNSMNLILEGEIQTVYTMKSQLVNKLHSDLQLNTKIYEFLQKDEDYIYHIDFKNPQGTLQYQNYVLTMATFTGDLNIEFYKNREATDRLQSKEPFMYMGDVQYVLTSKQIQQEMKEGLYIKAISKNKISTFMMEVEGRSKSKFFEIHEHIYEFMPVEKQTLSYFKVARYDEGNSNKESLKVVFSLIQVSGKVNLQFRRCMSTQDDCLGDAYNNHSSKINAEYRNVGSKETYTITLSSDFWQKVNIVQKNAVILVVLNNQQGANSFAAVEYNVGNRPQFLRENKPIQSHILKNQLKAYKFVTRDQNIEKVRLHINKITGCFSTFVFRHEPTDEELTKQLNKVSGSLYETSQRVIYDPIVVVIRGQDSATYSLIVQPVHKDEKQMNFITLSEDVQFKIKISPNQYEVFEIVPIKNNIFYSYKSTGAIHSCVLKDNICEDKVANFTNQGAIVRQKFTERALYVKLRNPSSSKSIQVSNIFHSNKENHCELKKLGHLYKQLVKEGACFITTVDTAQDFQVLIVRQEVGHLSYTMALCDKLLNFAIKQNGQERYMVSADQITFNCQGHSEYTFVFSVAGGQEVDLKKPAKNIHLKYLVEYTAGRVILPDGIGYHGSEVTTEEPIKKFVYPLLNKVQTSIILSTEAKLFFLVKFIEAADRAQSEISINSYDLSSPSQKFYFLQSIYLKITEDNIKKSKCNQCQLLIYIFSKEHVGTVVDYTIEVTQNFVQLQQGIPKSGYLIQNSKAYYGFAIKSSGSMLVQVSDNNRNCAELYVSSLQYPDENRHMEKSFDGQIILQVSPTIMNYYITVRARKTCAYTVTAALTQGKSHIVKLERGVLGYCNLAENEIKLYTFKHLSDQAFKVISLHKYGHVEFYLNKTTPDEIVALMRQEKVDLDAFTYHSDFKNRLILDKSRGQFCKGCYYVLAVQAKKHTESSIFLGDQSTNIPMSEQKVINDILPKAGMVTRGEFYYFKQGILQAKVHSGKLQVQILYKDQSIKKTFQKNKQLLSHNFTLSKQQQNAYGSVTVIYTALQDNTIYSSRVKSSDTIEEDSQGNHYLAVDSNEPNYLYMNKGEMACVRGFIKRADERLFISFYSQDKQAAQQMKIVGKLNNNFTQISQDTTRNIISVAFVDAANQILSQAIPYELCMSHDTESISLTVTQSEETSLLPENLESLVVNKQIFDIYPQGNFLLDVFECRGTTKITYGHTKKELQKSKPKILDMIGMPDQPHAVRLQQGYSNLLLSVQGEMSLIRWIHIDEQQEKGLGYYVYSAGNMRYNSAFGEIEFIVDPLKQAKKTKTKIQNVRYNLYVSNSEEDLKYASLCEKYLPGSVLVYEVKHNSLKNNSFRFVIQKNKLMQKYKEAENLFFNMVADLSLKTPDETAQEYRFIYKSQELPAQVFVPSKLQQYDFSTLIIVLILLIVAIVVFSWAFVKIIVPMISRLKNRALVEDHGLENSKDKQQGEKQENLEPPPSSDRQGIMNMDVVVPQTQQKM